MKKLLAVLLALAMVMSLGISAYADGDTLPNDENERTIPLTITGILGHTYRVYQIYTGDVAEEDGKLVLSNVKYGQNHYPTVGTGGTNAIGTPVPEDDLKDFLNAQNPANFFLSQIKHATDNPYAIINLDGTESSVTINVAPGYYMIEDITDELRELPDGQTASPIMLKIAEETTIASKHVTISSEKKVDDKNDSNTTEDGVNWVDSADYDVNDLVPFQLSVTLPATLNTYDQYELTFHDKQAAGFRAPENFKIYILREKVKIKDIPAATETSSGYSILACNSDKCEYGGCSFTVKVGDIKDFYNGLDFAVGDKIVVEYESMLLDGANIGRAGNENSMYVCHPDGHTPKDTVTVLSYELKVNKVDGTEEDKPALLGAGFTLYKWIASAKNGAGDWVAIGDEIKGEDLSTFVWTGIDGGKYKLSETTTPPGYNTIADMEFVINATHTEEHWLADGNYALTNLVAKNEAETVVVFNDKDKDGNLDGKLEGNIENYKGVVLPETGAEGTMMLIASGATLVILAAVFLVTRKKMSIYED